MPARVDVGHPLPRPRHTHALTYFTHRAGRDLHCIAVSTVVGPTHTAVSTAVEVDHETGICAVRLLLLIVGILSARQINGDRICPTTAVGVLLWGSDLPSL